MNGVGWVERLAVDTPQREGVKLNGYNPAASALGRMARGVPKQFSEAELTQENGAD